MNKTQLIDALSERFEGNRKAAAAALDAVLDTITREVARGEKVAITGFGSFERKVRESRWVRNPRTGERIRAQAGAIARFKPGADLLGVVSGARKLPETALAVAADLLPEALTGKKAPTAEPPTAPATPPPAPPEARKSTSAAPGDQPPAKKTAAKKAAAKKSTTKKTAAKKTAAKKTAAKKTAAKKTATTTAAKKSLATKAAAKKAPATKAAAKKAPAKKAPPSDPAG